MPGATAAPCVAACLPYPRPRLVQPQASMALAKGFATCGGVAYKLVENPWFREFCRIQSQMAHEGQPWRPCGRDAVGKFVLKADKEEDAEAKQCFVDSYKGKIVPEDQ